MLVSRRLSIFADLRLLRQLVFDGAVGKGASRGERPNRVLKHSKCMPIRLPYFPLGHRWTSSPSELTEFAQSFCLGCRPLPGF